MHETEEAGADTASFPQTSEKKLKIDWSSLVITAQHVRRAGWEHRPIPAELTQIPHDVEVPEKLQQILTWSLMPGRDWPHPPQPLYHSTRVHDDGSTTSKNSETTGSVGSETETPATSIEDLSASSYETSRTYLGSNSEEIPSRGEKSMKSKIMVIMGLNKRQKPQLADVKATPSTAECTSCFEELLETEMTRLQSRQHWYCKVCLTTLIMTAMVTETSYPPRCCLSSIPLQQIIKALNTQQREKYQEKAAEYAVPATDRWYCPHKDCLKWIPASKLKTNKELGYNCPHCTTKLCRTCRGPAHPAKTECPQDFGLEATLETAEVEGWQRCYSCRALVEHNTGCRHMTCRCKAHFCYVCGLKWHTCSCTERDAADKRAAVQQRRQEKLAGRDTEAAAIAQAIAEVEMMERQEAEVRRLEEERREQDEQEQLQALEVERLEEELRRRQEVEKAEDDFRQALASSFEEDWNYMKQVYRRTMEYQLGEINARHKAEDIRLGQLRARQETDTEQTFDLEIQTLTKNSRKRRNRLTSRQEHDVSVMESRQEEEEDDMFLQVQMRLRGKSNKESRTERMLGEIRKQHTEEKGDLVSRHQAEVEDLETAINFDIDGLRRRQQERVDQRKEVENEQAKDLQKFGHDVGADRQYFEIVYERRRKMLSKHGSMFLASIASGEENPTGLSEFAASRTEPFLPEFDAGDPGSSGISRKPYASVSPRVSMTMNEYHNVTYTATERPSSRQVVETEDLYTATEVLSPEKRIPRRPVPGSFPMEVEPSATNPLSPAQATDMTTQWPAPLVIGPLRPQKSNSHSTPNVSQILTCVSDPMPISTRPHKLLSTLRKPIQSQPQPQSQYTHPAPTPTPTQILNPKPSNTSQAISHANSHATFISPHQIPVPTSTSTSISTLIPTPTLTPTRLQIPRQQLTNTDNNTKQATPIITTFPIPSPSPISPLSSSSISISSQPNTNNSTTSQSHLTMTQPKKSRWPFKKEPMTQEGMRRRMLGTVGDAMGSGGVRGQRL